MTTFMCAVVGSPIQHSLSPAMHQAAYRELGLNGDYQAIEVGAGGLQHFLARRDASWRGLSVTAPLKHEAAAAASVQSPDVKKLGVANTLVRVETGWEASNTDVPGAISALAAVGVTAIDSVRIYGAGATAVSMAYAVSKLGATRLELRVRDRGRALETATFAEHLGMSTDISNISTEPTSTVDLVITTVPVQAVSGLEHSITSTAHAVFEVVYDPWPTPVMVSAQQDGTPLVTGLDLLAHQAALQLTAMTGETVAPDILTAAALTELAAR